MFRAGLRRVYILHCLGVAGELLATMSRPSGSLTLVFDIRTASGRSVSQILVNNLLAITYTDVAISL